MTLANQQIDKIVREVLLRLQSELLADGAAPAAGPPQSPPAGEGAAAAEIDLQVADHVVSTATLEGRLAGVRRAIVRPSAVVTPAARDLLRDAGVTLNRTPTGSKKTDTCRVTLAVVSEAFNPGDLIRLLGQSVEVEQIARTGLATMADELGLAVARSGSLGVLLAAQPALATCLLNRRRGVRAAEGFDQAAVDAALESLGANALVINPQGKSTHTIRRMVESLCCERRTCPSDYRSQLA